MRLLFLLLLAANILYFGWAFNQQTHEEIRNAAAAMPAPSGARKLRLIRDLPSPPPLRQAVAAPGAGTAANLAPMPKDLVSQLPQIDVSNLAAESVQNTCLRFGPLPDEQQTTALADWFRSRQAAVRQRSSSPEDRSLFWVYLAPLGTEAGAREVLDELKKKGISDYRLISQGDLKNAVSLGLYSSQAAVNERLAELRHQGYKPVVVPYTGIGRVYWLDVNIPGGTSALQDVYQGFPSHFNSVPVKCSQIAMSEASQ